MSDNTIVSTLGVGVGLGVGAYGVQAARLASYESKAVKALSGTDWPNRLGDLLRDYDLPITKYVQSTLPEQCYISFTGLNKTADMAFFEGHSVGKPLGMRKYPFLRLALSALLLAPNFSNPTGHQ